MRGAVSDLNPATAFTFYRISTEEDSLVQCEQQTVQFAHALNHSVSAPANIYRAPGRLPGFSFVLSVSNDGSLQNLVFYRRSPLAGGERATLKQVPHGSPRSRYPRRPRLRTRRHHATYK
jgi:hypothetical protein